MNCTSPRTVGYYADGKTLCWSPTKYSKEYSTFQLPCGKCLECRLEYARSWAIRCIHEAKMHSENCFITLTYSNENLKSPKLDYSDFQKFMKKIRKLKNDPIGMFVTGEYGEKTKRPHWHAIIFGYCPKDLSYARSNERGDKIYRSDTLNRIWGLGHVEIGSVTLESAGYCARYAAKKLVHGKDQEHDYHPISKKSSKNAIGKRFIERYWSDVFRLGKIVLSDGSTAPIPRYYEKWFKDNKPVEFAHYYTTVKCAITCAAEQNSSRERDIWEKNFHERRDLGKKDPLTRNEIRKIIKQKKFEEIQNYLKLK